MNRLNKHPVSLYLHITNDLDDLNALSIFKEKFKFSFVTQVLK